MSLSEIAGDMMVQSVMTTTGGKATRTLSHGLELTLYNRKEHWYLRLYRGYENKLPSQTEINVCLKAFFGKDYTIEREGAREDSRSGLAYWLKIGK